MTNGWIILVIRLSVVPILVDKQWSEINRGWQNLRAAGHTPPVLAEKAHALVGTGVVPIPVILLINEALEIPGGERVLGEGNVRCELENVCRQVSLLNSDARVKA
jgi:hypothetical protein